nr:MAG TPA: hypothetical protein [Caudoviricetes sp.]
MDVGEGVLSKRTPALHRALSEIAPKGQNLEALWAKTELNGGRWRPNKTRQPPNVADHRPELLLLAPTSSKQWRIASLRSASRAAQHRISSLRSV